MKRHPYADFGLTIAVGLFIITLINALLFDFTIVKMLWFALCISYFVVSHKFPSDSKQVRNSTHALMALIVLGLIATILFDTKTPPTAHAFDGAAVDSTEEELVILEDKDIPVAIEVDSLDEDSTQAIDLFADSTNAVVANDTTHAQSTQPVNTEQGE